MSGVISDFFGYPTADCSREALQAAASMTCPILGMPCAKTLSRDGTRSGVCAIRQKAIDAPDVICCPIRLYAGEYAVLKSITTEVFGADKQLFAGRIAVDRAKVLNGAVAVFGHRWGGELRLPKRKGSGSYFVDWVLAKLNKQGELEEFVAVEVQTIDTTGSYRKARQALLDHRKVVGDTVGLNWENVSKRIIPQLIYKGQVLQREDLCRKGLFFVCPTPIFRRVIDRLGGFEKLPTFSAQPASIHFLAYDYSDAGQGRANVGGIRPLGIMKRHDTTVYKVQEAFSSISLPEANVYQKAIVEALQ
jgi:hypothetical protein